MARTTATAALAALVALTAARAPAGILHRYLLDGGAGTSVADSAGTAHGTAKSVDGGTGSWTAGKFGGAWSSLSNGFLSFPATGIPSPIPMSQGSFVSWVRLPTGAASWADPLVNHLVDTEASWGSPMRHEIHSGGTARVYSIPNGLVASSATIETPTPIRDNRWHQWLSTYDAATGDAVLYIDGIERGRTDQFDTTGVTLRSTWRLGRREETSGTRCAGTYDNAAVYDQTLTPTEANLLYYKARDGVSLSTVPHIVRLRHRYAFDAASHPTPTQVLDGWDGWDGTVTGGVWDHTDNPPQDTGSWRKTANGDHVFLPLRVNLLEGTFEGWFKSETSAATWSNPLATSIRDINEPHGRDSMRLEVTADNTYIFDSPGAGTVDTGVDTTDGQWHHLAFTYQHGEPVRLYIDGLLAGTSPNPYDALSAYDRQVAYLGSRLPGEVTGWRGSVGSVGYYDEALPPHAIWWHYTTGISEHVPEPATLSLLGLGALALVRRRRN